MAVRGRNQGVHREYGMINIRKGGQLMKEEMIVRRLGAADYDEALDFLNMVYSMAGRPHDFLRALPRMWARDDAHMGKHIAVIRAGKIRSMLGVYPLPVQICGRKLLFSTVGNVATHPYETGKGYMSLLLDAAMTRLDEIGADASRLSGLRHRYARYGYEPVGLQHFFMLTAHNIRMKRPGAGRGISFRAIGAQDTEILNCADAMRRRLPMAAERGEAEDFYRVLSAWESRPAAAFRAGRMIGYLVPDQTGGTINECIAGDDEETLDMLCAWLTENGLSAVRIPVDSWRAGLIRLMNGLCESVSSGSPCRFYLRNWDRVTDALLALRSSMGSLPSGETVIGIEGWGALHMKVDGVRTSVVRTEEAPEIRLSSAQAAQLLAGPMKPECVCEMPEQLNSLLSAWLPLPLSWCTLDRV